MTALEQQFTNELLQCCKLLQEKGIRLERMHQQAEKFGGVRAVQDYLRRGGMELTPLAAADCLRESIEVLVTSSKYGELFSDDEVNLCFQALCEAGYY